MTSPKQTLSERMRVGSRMAETVDSSKDGLQHAFDRVKGAMAAAWSAYTNPPEWQDFQRLTGAWSGAEQFSNWELKKFVENIKTAMPNALRREAISNWIEASGDETVLKERAGKSSPKLAKGYEAALNLTPDELTVARNIQGYYDGVLEEAQKAGILEQGVENYVDHIWKRDSPLARKIGAEINFSSLQPNPKFARQRKIPTYFDGEQLGLTPETKDIGALVTAHDQAFQKAIASRAYIKSLLAGKASDGRPLAVVSWASAKDIPGVEGDKGAYFIKPNIKPGEESADYRVVDHPALRKWRWADDVDGKNVFVQGDILLHPEIYGKVKNNLSTSAIRNWTVEVGGKQIRPGELALNAQANIKSFILSFSGFHQTTLGVHALEHRTSPFNQPELDLNDPTQRALVDHGLMVADFHAAEAFGEGLASGGLVTKIPGIGPLYHAYSNYLFGSYLPRIKMAMAQHALDRNRKVYGKKLNDDQILALTASQANAAFGGLNLRMLSRSKTVQDGLRLLFMAPDFFEARARFAGQAGKPHGREQLSALVFGAAVLFMGAQALNLLLDKQTHPDKPFSVVYKGHEYRLRTVQEDIWRFATSPREFMYGRISPLAKAALEATTGRDDQGHKRDLPATLKDYGKEMAPIPAQPFTSSSDRTTGEKIADTALRMVGVNMKQSRSAAEEKASELMRDRLPASSMTPEQEQKYRTRRNALDKARGGDIGALHELMTSGKLSIQERHELLDESRHSKLYSTVKRLPYSDALKVMEKATPEEKKELSRLMIEKRNNLLKRGGRAKVSAAEQH